MSRVIEYKGYVGSIEFSEEDCMLYGKVQGIRSLISYEGKSAEELLQDFHGAVDDYLTMCAEEGIEPEKAYKGTFNVRVSPELHQAAAMRALSCQMTLNSIVETALKQYIALAD